MKNFHRHGGRNVLIEKAGATRITAADLLVKVRERFKAISIDEGHAVAHTLSDIQLANAVVHPFHFMIVGDILCQHRLCVIDGATSYLPRRRTG